jgi:hypothetical protein
MNRYLRRLLWVNLLALSSLVSQTIIRDSIKLVPRPANPAVSASIRGTAPHLASDDQTDLILVRVGGLVQVWSLFPVNPGSIGDSMEVLLNGERIFFGNMCDAHYYNRLLYSANVAAATVLRFECKYYVYDARSQTMVLKGPFPQITSSAVGAKNTVVGVVFQVDSLHWNIDGGKVTILNVDYSQPDSSSVADFRPPSGPPLRPTPIIAPTDGQLVGYLFYDCAATDSVWYRSNGDSLMVDPEILYGFDFPEVVFGTVHAGDTLRFSLVSGARGTIGQTMYPDVDYFPDFVEYDFEFEDWYDDDLGDIFAYTYIVPAQYRIWFDRDVAAPGDTVRMFIKPLGTPEDPNVGMDVNILEGRRVAVLQDTLGNVYGKDVFGEPNGGLLRSLRIVIDSSAGKRPFEKRIIVQALGDWGDALYSGRGELRIEKPRDILLGETKYYQARPDPNNSAGLIFVEMSETSGWVAGGQAAQFTVTAEQPVSKLGVYYEFKDNDGLPLAGDMIRIIGRYWKQDTTYKVRLTATSGVRSGSIVIEVKKPDVLGDPNLTDNVRHTRIIDVKGDTLWLDEEIFRYAGEWGIPPQLIKGQIDKETLPHFAFNWRYEPFKDIEFHSSPGKAKLFFKEDIPFVVTESSMGTGDLPTLHRNEVPFPYVNSPVKRSEYVTKNWDAVYVQHHTGDELDKIIGSRDLTKHWAELYSAIRSNNNISDADARNEAHNKLKGEIQDPDNEEFGEDFDDLAQTRIVTSYGLVQMMYTTAVSTTFKETGSWYGVPGSVFMDRYAGTLPSEKLNEYEYSFPRYVDWTLQHLRKTLGVGQEEGLPDHNWSDGYESIWVYTMQKHNAGETDTRGTPLYGLDVLRRAGQYWPSKNQ